MNRILTRKAFGLPTDPWSRLHLATADTGRVRDMIGAAIDDCALVSVVGQTGIGKSRAFAAALRDRPGFDPERDLIRVRRLDRERRTIGDVVTAIYHHLGQPRPTGAEARDIELRRVLGQAAAVRDGRTTRRLVLMLDDAHLLHWRTIDALKGLREHDWMGVAPLIGVVLLGQRDPLGTRKEIRQRADTLTLHGLATAEARVALEQTVARALSDDALDTLAEHAAGRTWNDLIESVDTALRHAQAAGHTQVEHIDAVQATGAGLRELAQAVGISQAEIARKLNTGGRGRPVSETQVSRVMSGERKDADLQDRIAALLLGGDKQPQAAAG
jgi:type II secretory pathway predicted ATPase ExeA